MEIDQLEDCCALDLAWNFRVTECTEEGEPDRLDYAEYTKEEVLAQLDNRLKQQRGEIPGWLRAGTILTLNQYQVEFWGKDLRERGFRCVSRMKNPNSGNVVHVFILVHERSKVK